MVFPARNERGPVQRRLLRIALATLLASIASSLAPSSALADDVVLLKNGGRVRGQVMSEHPKDGVKVKLADGRVRAVPAEEVSQVVYDGQPMPSAPAPSAEPSTPSTPPSTPSPPSTPPGPPPSTPLPPPPPPSVDTGTIAVDAEEPGVASIDGAPAGKIPVTKVKVPAGDHTVTVEFEAGGKAEERVTVTAGKTASVKLAVPADEKSFRSRRGPSFGATADTVFLFPVGAIPMGGARLSAFVNITATSSVDLRIGASGAGAGGASGARSFPVGGFFAAVLHPGVVLLNLGIEGGYAPGPQVRTWDSRPPGPDGSPYTTRLSPLATFGGLAGISVAIGADRRWEIGLRQDVAAAVGSTWGASCNGSRCAVSGAPKVVLTTGLGITGLLFPGGSSPKTTGALR